MIVNVSSVLDRSIKECLYLFVTRIVSVTVFASGAQRPTPAPIALRLAERAIFSTGAEERRVDPAKRAGQVRD